MDAVDKRSLLPIITDELTDKVMTAGGSTWDEAGEKAFMLSEWIYSQPHLPKVRETTYRYCGFLGRVLFRKKMSMERAKEFIDTYYTMRTLAPELLMNRDPADPQLRASMEHYRFAAMPTLTDSLTRVYVAKIVDKTFEPHMLTDWHKYSLMLADVQQWDDTSVGDEIIIDFGNVTLQLVSVMTPAVIKKLFVCYLTWLIFSPKSFHFVNVPAFAEVVFNVIKSMLKPKIANRVFAHYKAGYQTLHEHISPKYLPKDFGGEGPTIDDVHAAWLEKVDSLREWYLENDKYVVQEQLRPEKSVSHSDIFGMEGSFRKLVVD